MAEEHQLTRRELRERRLAAEREAQSQAEQQSFQAAESEARPQYSSHLHAAEPVQPVAQAPEAPLPAPSSRRARTHTHAAPPADRAEPQPVPRRSRERLPAVDEPVPPRASAGWQPGTRPLLAEPAAQESAAQEPDAQPVPKAESKAESKAETRPEVTPAEKAAAVLPRSSQVAERVVAQNLQEADGAPKGASFIRTEPVDKPEPAKRPEPAEKTQPAEKTSAADQVQLSGGVSTGPATARVLVLPSTPEQNFTLPLDSTGDVVLTTGSITLPQLTTDTGIIPAVFERDAGDPLADSSDRLPITDENRPISAVDTVRRYESDVILPSSPEHSRLNAAGIWLLVGAGVLIVAATAFVLLRIFG